MAASGDPDRVAVVDGDVRLTLADLRRSLHDEVKARLIGEIDKDLTNVPVGEIERRIASGGGLL